MGLCYPGALKKPQVEELVPAAQGASLCVSGDLKKLTSPYTFPPSHSSPQGWHRDHLSDGPHILHPGSLTAPQGQGGMQVPWDS